jgi:hypothetical protein
MKSLMIALITVPMVIVIAHTITQAADRQVEAAFHQAP